jgi:hypothetical protein
VAKLVWHGEEALRVVRGGAARGLKAGADLILSGADAQVPTESEDLRHSGRASVDEAGLRAAVSFGRGDAAAYAVHQHEDLQLHHDGGRKAKYLEDPMNQARAAVLRLLADHIAEDL